MELNTEQIIKALECCSRQYKDDTFDECPDCIYHNLCCDCVLKAITDALALIKELTEENERLRAEGDLSTKVEVAQYDEGQGLKVVFYANGNEIGKANTVDYNGKQNAFLHGLEVKAEYRSKGYGSRIIAYMIDKYGVCDLYVGCDNDRAIRLYEKHGFYKIDRFIKEDKTYLVMTRDLSKVKADTVRKMQERLDKHFCHDPAFLGVEQRLVMDVIDQIAKEMLEENNEN